MGTDLYAHFIDIPVDQNTFFEAHTLTELN
jgi:hypothetical protein